MHSAQHKRCLNCGYILDGLPENRCPECGRPFDPEDPDSFTWGTRHRSGWAYLGLAIACWVAAELPRVLLDSGSVRGSWFVIALLATMAGAVALGILVLVKSVVLIKARYHDAGYCMPFELAVIASSFNALRALHYIIENSMGL